MWRSCWPRWSLHRTGWSSRLLAAELGISNVKVADVWREWGLQPWWPRASSSPPPRALEAKFRDVIGLYLNPPDKVMVPCVDEKPVTQALERNLIGVFFSVSTRQAIRCGSFTSIKELIAAIEDFIDGWNDRCHPFTWTKTADEILPKRRPDKRTSFTRH